MQKRFGHFKWIFLPVFILISSCFWQSLSAQTDTTHSKESKGVGEIKNGLKEGIWKFYYPGGNLMAKETYRDGELNGQTISYFPGGKISSIENWKEDLQEDSSWYFHPNGRLNRKGQYEKGVYQGFWLTFYPTGQLQQSGSYVDGLPSGFYRNWFENGALQEEGTYREGKKEGQFVYYHPNAKDKIQLIAVYSLDLPSGVWIYFDRKSKVTKLEKFDR